MSYWKAGDPPPKPDVCFSPNHRPRVHDPDIEPGDYVWRCPSCGAHVPFTIYGRSG